MNLNVIVLNMYPDVRALDLSERRDRKEGLAGRPGLARPAEEVIELVPRDGTWVGRGDVKEGQRASLKSSSTALPRSSAAMTYDNGGRVRYETQHKGLRIDITA